MSFCSAIVGVEVFERDGLAIGVGSVPSAGAPSLGDLAGAGNILDDGEVLAGGGHDVQTRDFDGRRRSGLLDRTSLVVEDGTNSAVAVAADDHVADPKSSFTDQDRSDDAPALGERGFEAGAGRRPGRVGLELVKLGDRFQRRQQLGDAQSARGGRLDDLGFAAPLGGIQPLLRQLAVNLVDIRRRVDVGQVDLVEGDDDRHTGRLGVGDGLDRLGHHAVVGSHDQHHDVGHVGAAGAHRRESLVAGGVDERDGACRSTRPGTRRCAA